MGADVNEPCNSDIDQATPLHFAVMANKHQNAFLLLDKGANPNLKDNEGDTPLHIAVNQQDPEMIALLTQFNSKLKVKNKKGMTPVDIAQSRGNLEILRFFLDSGKLKF